MARIDLDHIKHSYLAHPKSDADYARKEVHHSWEDGGAYALLGPSGCGKTTLLGLISRLVRPFCCSPKWLSNYRRDHP